MTKLSDKAKIVRMSNEASDLCTRLASLVSDMQKLDADNECVVVGASEVTDLKQKFNTQYLSVKEQIAAAIDKHENTCTHSRLIAIKYNDREVFECMDCGKVLSTPNKNAEIVETIDKY